MKIVICGSSAFREKMVEFCDKLRDLKHEPIIINNDLSLII